MPNTFRQCFAFKTNPQLLLVLTVTFTGWSLGESAIAQIVPDNTLGIESSIVTPVSEGVDRIDGGAIRGENLFHSFEDFNIGEGRRVDFSNPNLIENILTRVTGNNPSNIFGTLGVLGDANLFLLNPNGIIFGENARLDLNGSFFASTADRLVFENGLEFSASNPEAAPLLSVNVPLGVQFGNNPGEIVVRGAGSNLPPTVEGESLEEEIDREISTQTEFLNSAVGLRVNEGETLALVGGNLTLEGGVVKTPSGRIELGSVGENVRVELEPLAIGWQLNYPEIESFGDIFRDINFLDRALVMASGERGGEIRVRGDRVTLSDSSLIFADTLGDRDGIGININARQLTLNEALGMSTTSLGSGTGGDLTIRALESVHVSGETNRLQTNAWSTGNAGNFSIDTTNFSLLDGAQVLSITLGRGNAGDVEVNATELVEVIGTSTDETFGSILLNSVDNNAIGKGGNLTINTARFSVRDGAFVAAGTFGRGNSGNLEVNASEFVEVVGRSANGNLRSSLLNTVGDEVVGNGGNLTINTARFSVRDGAFVATGTSGQGNAGNLTIRASESIDIRNNSQLLTNTFNRGNAGNLTLQAAESIDILSHSIVSSAIGTNAIGDGGDLTLETSRLTIDRSSVFADNFNRGNAGNLTIRANESIDIRGNSRLSNSINTGAIGNGGDFTVETARLIVRDESSLRADIRGEGNGGNLTVRATESASIIDRSFLSAVLGTEAVGNGGDLTVDTNRLTVADNSFLSIGNAGNGDSGNLVIRATDSISLRNNAFLDGSTSGRGNAGNLIVRASESIDISQESIISSDVTGINSTGHAGDLIVETSRFNIRDRSFLSTSTAGRGNAGNLTIRSTNSIEVSNSNLSSGASLLSTGQSGNLRLETARLSVRDGSLILTSTLGEGNAGNLTIRATDSVEVIGNSSLSSDTFFLSTGEGGNLEIETVNLTVRDGSSLSTFTAGEGNAGNLTIRATDSVDIVGDSSLSSETSFLSTGEGGNLTVDTARLTLDNASVRTSTFGEGNAGNLTLRASESIDIDNDSLLAAGVLSDEFPEIAFGETTSEELAGNLQELRQTLFDFISASILDTDGLSEENTNELIAQARVAIFSDDIASGFGDGGIIRLATPRLTVRDSLISLNTIGEGAAGNLAIEADSVLLDNRANLQAVTFVGDRGNITFDTSRLILRRGSEIVTNSESEFPGGNITIDTDVLAALENSDITANAQNAEGGRVTVNAQGIFGTQFRNRQTSESDITATSALGPAFSGIVELNTPDIETTSGLVDLSETPVDVARILSTDPCSTGRDNEFYITGRGGLPPNPEDIIPGEATWIDWRSPSFDNAETDENSSVSLPNLSTESLVEADSWHVDSEGNIVLSANADIRSRQIGELSPSGCTPN
ncbi:MAG: filamentous hemagglutinin N-terminal domain-containing protein [Cyanobacteria bacterium SID2]|nr:filamentous hemagglutinin N-terminal domain-containing protein [Cyanobacteria bacterium SID2]